MDLLLPIANEGSRHPLRRSLPPATEVEETLERSPREDVAFFMVSFASAFVILYGFVL
jgi:hypothetical protein